MLWSGYDSSLCPWLRAVTTCYKHYIMETRRTKTWLPVTAAAAPPVLPQNYHVFQPSSHWSAEQPNSILKNVLTDIYLSYLLQFPKRTRYRSNGSNRASGQKISDGWNWCFCFQEWSCLPKLLAKVHRQELLQQAWWKNLKPETVGWCFLYSSYLNGFHFWLTRAMVWIVGSFPVPSVQVSSPNRFCWRWVALPPCVDKWNVGAGSLPRPGEERENWGFCGGFYASHLYHR